MTVYVPNLVKSINLRTKKGQRYLSKINTHQKNPYYIIIKLLKIYDEDKNFKSSPPKLHLKDNLKFNCGRSYVRSMAE